MTPSQGKMRLKSALQKLNLLLQKLYEKVIHEIVASIARPRFRIVTQPRVREKPFYVTLTAFSTAKETKSETKPVTDSESKSKIKVRSQWTVFLVSLMPAVICV